MQATGVFQLRITAVIPETQDASTFVLEETAGRTIPYEPGQFFTFLIDHHGHEVRRSFSIGSTPGIDRQLFMTVKRKENGEISRFILDHWQPGTIVQSIPPSGRFTIVTGPAQARHIFFLAAGSGIVPVFSLLKNILLREPLGQVTLLYQNHDETSIIYHRQLEYWQQQYPDRFHRIDLLSHPLLHEIPPQRLNNGLLEQLVNSIDSSRLAPPLGHETRLAPPLSYGARGRQGFGGRSDLFYTCGPPAFMRMVQFTLRVMGFAEEQLRKENFTIDVIPAPAFTIDPSPRRVTVHIGDQTYRYEVSYPTTILQAALNNHIELPYSCKGGRCATCTANCRSGVVKMSINEVLTEKDLQQGLVLTCVGFAQTDVELTI